MNSPWPGAAAKREAADVGGLDRPICLSDVRPDSPVLNRRRMGRAPAQSVSRRSPGAANPA